MTEILISHEIKFTWLEGQTFLDNLHMELSTDDNNESLGRIDDEYMQIYDKTQES